MKKYFLENSMDIGGVVIISFLIVLLILTAISVVYFLSLTLSPIPYFPTNKKDIDQIVSILLKGGRKDKEQIIIDLGAGTGTVIFEVAKQSYKRNLNNNFIAVEINPVLVAVMTIRSLFHSNRKSIAIVCKDMFKTDLTSYVKRNRSLLIYLYISPWHMKRLIPRFIELPKGRTQIVSYMYKIDGLQDKLVKIHKGVNLIYEYSI